ncbi:hypothetical protein [Halomonas sp. H10-9-1]
MIAAVTPRLPQHAVIGRGASSCVAASGFWYGYFMTGVPAAMS